MIHSMTAFARGERVRAQGRPGVEIRTVNHRYLDATQRLAALVAQMNHQ